MRYSTYMEYVKGHPKKPMTMEDCIEKFKKCLPYSERPFSEENVNRLIQTIAELEKLDDVSPIINAMTKLR